MNLQQTACPVRDKLSLNSGYILPSLLAVTDVLSCFCHLCWQLCLVQAALLQGSKSEVSIFLLCSVVQMCPCFFLCQPSNLPSTPGSFCPDAHLTFTSFPERKHDHTVSWPPKIPCMNIVKRINFNSWSWDMENLQHSRLFISYFGGYKCLNSNTGCRLKQRSVSTATPWLIYPWTKKITEGFTSSDIWLL